MSLKAFLAFSCLFAIGLAFAQQQRTYLDANFKQTDSASAKYYREVSKFDRETFRIRTYYKSGALQQEGQSVYESVPSYMGDVTTYWENGNKQSRIEYSKAKKVGPVTWWHENGKPKLIGRYESSTETTAHENQFLITEFWDETGTKTVSAGNGHYRSSDADFTEEGDLANEKRVGKWKGQDHLLDLTYEEEYDPSGKLVSGHSTHSSGQQYTYTNVIDAPTFPDGVQAFYKFVARNYRAPEKGPSGRLAVNFVVQKDGSLTNLKIVKSLSPEADAEALRMFGICGPWIPGKSRGYPVRVSYSLPISIQSGD